MDRRTFLYRTGGAMLSGSAAWTVLRSVVPAHAAQAAVTPDIARFTPEMEDIVRWIEDTPRERILDAAVDHLKAGLPYRALLGGVFLAGIRNIQPRPVGGKFHAVLAIHAMHQLALDAPQEDRLIPLFYALDGEDGFKNSQQVDARVNDWSLAPVKESAVPPAAKARERFREAMEHWDAEAADVAVVALARATGTAEVCEWLWEYGSRSVHGIGHKMIYCANAVRTLHTIGWQHAEPVLRSIVYGLLDAQSDAAAWSTFEPNRVLLKTVRADWQGGKVDAGAATAFLDTLRQASPEKAAADAVAALNRGIAAQSVWDGILLFAAELAMRQPDFVALHATTSANALYYAYRSSGRDATRLLLLLQAASWMAMFRLEFARRGDPLPEDGPRIDKLDAQGAGAAATVDGVFDRLTDGRLDAARNALTLLQTPGAARAFMSTARHWICRKGGDHHDFKFPVAAFEDFACASPGWRPRLLAASMFLLKGAKQPDSDLMVRARRALARLP